MSQPTQSGKAIEAVIEKDKELLEMIKGQLPNLKKDDELGFTWGKKHFIIKKGDFSK